MHTGASGKQKGKLERDVERGQAVYTPLVLSIYDIWVLKISNSLIWRCPTSRLLAHYAAHLTGHHLEAGVGTAYLLHHSRFSTKNPKLTLLDLNPTTLAYGGRRLARYAPRTRVANLLEPIEFDERYTSAAMNYVLHCLPGTLETKGAAFANLKRGVAPGGVIFGATLLGKGIELSGAAKRLMGIYNRKGIFSNAGDDLAGLDAVMKAHFERYTIDVVGCAALFVGYC